MSIVTQGFGGKAITTAGWGGNQSTPAQAGNSMIYKAVDKTGDYEVVKDQIL